MRRLLSAALALPFLFSAPQAAAWGPNGHRIVGALGEAQLPAGVGGTARDILRGMGLAQIATWPDEIRADPSWACAAPFHFTTIAPGAPYPGEAVEQGDAVQALVWHTDRLRDPGADAETRRIALAFVVHLIGDLHQPLHGGLGCDRGGNAVQVNFFGERVNLHTVWDEGIIEQEALSFTEFAAFLLDAEAAMGLPAASASPLDWIESGRAHMAGAYSCDIADRCVCYTGDCADGLSPFGACAALSAPLKPETVGVAPRLSYNYLSRNLPVVRARLAGGGRALAAHLGWALDPDATAPEAYRALAEAVRAMPGWDAAPGACRGDAVP